MCSGNMNGVVITTTPPGEPAQVRERRVDVSHVLEHFRAQQQRVPALGPRPRVRKHVQRADDVDGAGAVLHHADYAEASGRVRIGLHLLAKGGLAGILAPDLAVTNEQALLGSEAIDDLAARLLSAAFA